MVQPARRGVDRRRWLRKDQRRDAAAHALQAAVRRRRFWRTLAVMRIQRSFRAHLARRLVKGLKEVTRLRSLCR